MDTSEQLLSEQVGSATTAEEVEPFLEETIELAQERPHHLGSLYSQPCCSGRCRFDR